MTLRSSDLALLKLANVELDTSGTERSFPASSDISYKYTISIRNNKYHSREIMSNSHYIIHIPFSEFFEYFTPF